MQIDNIVIETIKEMRKEMKEVGFVKMTYMGYQVEITIEKPQVDTPVGELKAKVPEYQWGI